MRKRLATVIISVVLLVSAVLLIGGLMAADYPAEPVEEGARNVIFFHPDGYGLSHWNALRFWQEGPDGRLNWDRLSYMAPYTGHMKDALTGSSHGGATTHAYGVKVVADSFGLDGDQVITALSGRQMSIMEEAIQAGFATALIQTGCITEPGTAVFVASVEDRFREREAIAKQVIESGVDVILGGGERWLLPEGVTGRHGDGRRGDGLNLIEKAKALGYTVVYTRDELMAVAGTATKVLGVFASGHTFNAKTEEVLRAEGLPHFWPWAPTIAEMSTAALEILARNPKATEKGIFVVAEEEGTDNFPNSSNASGSFEAGKRADEAFGVFADFVEENPNTLLLTAADSSAGAKSILGPDSGWMAWMRPSLLVDGKLGEININTGPDGEWALAPPDGVDGAGTEPFLSAPDKAGNRWPFAVTWAFRFDVSGGVVARAMGLNADLVTELGVVDNTDIYRIMYYTLFDRWLAEARPLGKTVEAGPTAITILHTGDFHGRLDPFKPRRAEEYIGGIARIATLVNQIRAEQPNTILLDAGDTIHGTNLANLLKGESVITAMNAIGYTAMVVGNHDFNFGRGVLQERAEQAEFPILGANVQYKIGESFLPPYTVVEAGGLRIGIIGLVTTRTPIVTHPKNVQNLEFLDPVEVTREIVEQLAPQVDLIVLLAHTGTPEVRRVLMEVPGIAVSVNADAHLESVEQIGDTIVAHSGEHGKVLGRLDIVVENGRVIDFSHEFLRITPDIVEDASVNAVLAPYRKQVGIKLAEVIGETEVVLDGEREDIRSRETNLGNLVADVIRERAGADIAIQNGGGIRASIDAGPITLEEIFTVLPFDNYVVALKLTGEAIWQALENGVSDESPSGAFPQVSGMSFAFDPTRPSEDRIVEVTIGGEPLELDRTYIVATNCFLAAGGDGYWMFKEAEVVLETGDFLRDAMAAFIREREAIRPEVEDRIRILGGS